MIPQLFPVIANDPDATVELGTGPVRFYPFGEAPAVPVKPYAVWQVIGGSPYNPMTDAPNVDAFGVQVDVYASDATAVAKTAKAVRAALEKVCYVTSWRGTTRDPETRDYRVSFDIHFSQER